MTDPVKVNIVDSNTAPRRSLRRSGSWTNLLRRLQQGKTAVLTFPTDAEAKSAQATIRVAARKAGIIIETYRAKGEPNKLCITKVSGNYLGVPKE